MKDRDTQLIFEAWNAPGGRPVERGLGSDGNGWTDTGFEELDGDLEKAFQAALDMHAKLPNDKKGEDYAELYHNFKTQIENFIEEIEIKIHNPGNG